MSLNARAFDIAHGDRYYSGAGREGLKDLLAIVADERDERSPISACISLVVLKRTALIVVASMSLGAFWWKQRGIAVPRLE
jgi:hypothetical protein